MITYKDRTFCASWNLCKYGWQCDRALTRSVWEEAARLEMPVSVCDNFEQCFVDLWGEVKEGIIEQGKQR